MADHDDFPGLYFPDDEGKYDYDSPCWNDDWEHDLRDGGSKTLEELNSVGRVINKGEKGTYLPCAEITVFSESRTSKKKEFKFSDEYKLEFSDEYKLELEHVFETFETFQEAMTWARNNPGRVITRSPVGNGYIITK